MKIILMRTRPGRFGTLRPSPWLLVFGAMLLWAAGMGAAGYAGFRLGGAQEGISPRKVQRVTTILQGELDAQRQALERAREDGQVQLDALAIRLGDLQAQMMRVNALGERLTRLAGLDEGEFDFAEAPPQGGPLSGEVVLPSMTSTDFEEALAHLAERLDAGQRQLDVLAELLLTRNLSAELRPSGNPVHNGWLSSTFGGRTDPLTGRLAWHSGVDIAGKPGSEVLAVAAGVVSFAGEQEGYGNLVEVSHANGLKTRYGHNQRLLVKVGEVVRRGAPIALLGSSGRSTGPHVHFEVLNEGKQTDPADYLQAAR